VISEEGGPDEGLDHGLAVLRAAREAGAPAARARGTIALVEENCTVCMLCARECPDWCLYVEGHTEEAAPVRPGGRARVRNVLDRFAIDWSLCMYCGICVEVCPFDALFWAPALVPATEQRPSLVEERADLRAWVREVPAPPALDPAAEPAEEVAAAARLEAVAAARTRR
jgi:NADH-quinone oxidoreductase subunit I